MARNWGIIKGLLRHGINTGKESTGRNNSAISFCTEAIRNKDDLLDQLASCLAKKLQNVSKQGRTELSLIYKAKTKKF